MPRSKQIFLMVAVLFTATMVYITFDIFSRTTRPGAKKHLIESIKPTTSPASAPPSDSLATDSLR